MTAYLCLRRAIAPFPIRRLLSWRSRLAVRVDPAIYLSTLRHLAQQWEA